MAGFTILSFVLSVLALIGSSPFWSKLLIHYFYSPDLEVFLPPPGQANPKRKWENISGVSNLPINVKNNTSREFKYRIVIKTDTACHIIDERLIEEHGLIGGFPKSGGFRFKMSPSRIVPYGTSGTAFPVEPKSFPSDIKIELKPIVALSDFGLPDFFGTVSLKPISAEYTLVDNS